MAAARRTRTTLSLLLALALIVLGIWWWTQVRPTSPGAESTSAGTVAPTSSDSSAGEPGEGVPGRPADAFALTVKYVFDGDTIEAVVHKPNEVVTTTKPIRIRLIGIDTPEGTPTPECWAEDARDHLRQLLPAGSTVWAVPDVEWRDRYGRSLLYLWNEQGAFVNYELAAAGDATPLRVRPNDEHYDLFVRAAENAEAAGRGQWGAC